MRLALALALLSLLAACRDELPGAPAPRAVTPDRGASDAATPIVIEGEGLVPWVRADFGDSRRSLVDASFFAALLLAEGAGEAVPLEQLQLSGGRLTAVVPAGVSVGTYDLVVTNAAGEEGVLAAAYRSVTPSEAVARFVFAPIDAQPVGVGFTVFLEAVDSVGVRVDGFDGYVDVADRTGTLAPSRLGPFARGVLTGQVAVLALIQEDVLTATDGRGRMGESNGFGVGPGLPAALALTRPVPELRVGQCSERVRVRTEDAGGRSAPVANDIRVALLASPDTGLGLFGDAACSVTVDALTVPTGVAEAGLYLRASAEGEWTLRAFSQGLPAAIEAVKAVP